MYAAAHAAMKVSSSWDGVPFGSVETAMSVVHAVTTPAAGHPDAR
jgi:hypothetical protein